MVSFVPSHRDEDYYYLETNGSNEDVKFTLLGNYLTYDQARTVRCLVLCRVFCAGDDVVGVMQPPECQNFDVKTKFPCCGLKMW